MLVVLVVQGVKGKTIAWINCGWTVLLECVRCDDDLD